MLRSLINQTKIYIQQQARQYAQAHRYRPNSGIRRQVKAETNELEYEVTDWDDDLSKYEGDLTNTSEIYEQYRQESGKEKENLRHRIVRNKYFNEKKPTFLTWAEMEQIRMLNEKDPEEWNDQKLSESFPADAATIKKILKVKWQPRDSRRIAKHDENVRLNWKSFVNGELKGMDHRFSEHLRKFSERNLNLKVNYDGVTKKELPKPKSTEFLGIITSCKKYKREPKQITSEQITTQLPERSATESLTPQVINSHKLYTFKSNKPNENMPARNEAEIIFDNPSGTGIEHKKNSNQRIAVVDPLDVSKYENNEVELTQNDLKQLSVSSIRLQITIPEKLFKEGATYRLEDCYYDDDGEFLYRVPGMTKV